MSVMPVDVGQLQKAVASAGATSQLFFVLRKKEKVEGKNVYSLYLRRVGLTEEVAEELRGVLGDWLDQVVGLGGLKFEKFEPDFTPGSAVVIPTLPASDVPELPRLLAEIAAPDKVPEPKKIDPEFLASLWAIALRVDSAAGSVVVFRRYYGSKVAKVDQPLRFLYRGRKLKKSKTTIVFSFDDKLDALVVGKTGEEVVLVLQKNIFEQMFFMAEKVYAPQAEKVKKRLKKLALVENFDEFSETIDKDPAKVKKTAEIMRNVKAAVLKLSDLIRIAKEWEIDLELNATKTAFVSTPQTAWPLLKLLADDNLESPLTQNKYEVSSKRLIP